MSNPKNMRKNVFVSSEESFVVMDYATLENVEVEYGEDAEGRMSSPGKNSANSYLVFRLLMSRNSEGRTEQMCLVAESRYGRFQLPSAMKCIIRF